MVVAKRTSEFRCNQRIFARNKVTWRKLRLTEAVVVGGGVLPCSDTSRIGTVFLFTVQ